jgi:hypothetical protein
MGRLNQCELHFSCHVFFNRRLRHHRKTCPLLINVIAFGTEITLMQAHAAIKFQKHDAALIYLSRVSAEIKS